MEADDKRHGSPAGYCQGCRETCCRQAMAIYERHRRTRRYLAKGGLLVPGLGTRRRLQALTALGWSGHVLDVQLSRGRSYTSRLITGTSDVNPATAKLVADTYARLCMTAPPQTTHLEKQSVTAAQRYAARQGWAPPLAWDNIDDPDETPTGWAYQPLTPNTSSVHRLEVIQEIADRGGSISDVCAYFKLSPKAIERWLERQRLRPLFNTLKGREHIDGNHRNSRPGTRNPYYGDVA